MKRVSRLWVLSTFVIFASPEDSLAVSVSPDVRARYVAARTLMGEERYTEAWEALQQLIIDEPEFTPAYRYFVEVSSLVEDLPAAASYFEGRVAANPNDARAHYGLGLVANEMGDVDRAIESHQRALELDANLVEALDDRGGLTQAYQRGGLLDDALRYVDELVETHPDSAAAHYGAARVRLMRYEWEAALESASRAISLDPEMLRAQSLLVYIRSRTSQKRSLLDAIERLKRLAMEAADLDMESYAEMQFAVSYQNLGDYGRSLGHANEALRLARLYGQEGRELVLLNNIAALYGTAGNMEQAAQFFAQVAEQAGAVGEKELEVLAIVNLAHTKLETDLEESLALYERALALAREIAFQHGECLALFALGAQEEERDHFVRADELLVEALGCTRQIGDRRQEGHVLEQIAYVNERRGSLEKAVALYQQALSIGEETDNIEILWDAEGGLASTFEKLGDIDNALQHNMRAIGIYESVRATLDIQSVGSGFLNDKDEVYPSVIRLLAEAGRVEEAFGYAERYKSKNLLENMSQNANVLEELLPTTLRDRFLDVDGNLQKTHAALAEAQNSEKPRDEVVALEQRVAELELEKVALNRELQENHGEFYRLTRSEPLDIDAIQARLLGESDVLVEYVVGENGTSAFVLTKDDVHYELLPVGREGLVEMMEAWSPVFGKANPSKRRPGLFNSSLADFSIPGARTLYDALVGPLENFIPSGSQLIIVPDDVLFYLPFEALVSRFDGEDRYDFDSATFLLEHYPISYASAASLLESSPDERESAPGALLALGNPSFPGGVNEAEPSGTLTAMASYASQVLRDEGLVPLPYSEEEVLSIANVVGRGASQVAVGAEASEALFKEQASNYRILHLATHFLSDDRQPLYSKLALAPTAGIDEDGFLQVYEVLGKKLRAELVVLSACNTGLGRLQRGEGLQGATRAFLYAGVPSMVVSLWSVEDHATAEIMERFYVHLKHGADKREALQLAKRNYLRSVSGEKKDPFYWAPFILIGDASPMSFPESPWRATWWMAATALALAAITLWRLRAARRPA